MSSLMISQAEADKLLALKKFAANNNPVEIPTNRSITIPLDSTDPSEKFQLDIEKGGRINILRCKLQNRARQTIVLARLDFRGAAPHTNPDGIEIPSPHIHLYREGYADKWAYPVPDDFDNTGDFWETFLTFMRYCNVTKPPNIDRGLFDATSRE